MCYKFVQYTVISEGVELQKFEGLEGKIYNFLESEKC